MSQLAPVEQAAAWSPSAKKLSNWVQKNFLAAKERDILNWLCARLPRAVTPDRLTGLGLMGALIVSVSYVASRNNPAFLWIASLGFFVNWFGDSLDGSLARYRGVERPQYGYFVDHAADVVSILLIMVGLGLTSYVRFDVALLVLVAYLMMAIFVFLKHQVTGIFQLTFLAGGPTEIRIGFLCLNFWMYAGTRRIITIGGQAFSSYDFALAIFGTILFVLFFVNVLTMIRRLRAPSDILSVGNS